MLAGLAVDAVFADPVRRHPVAGLGRFAQQLEAWLWRPTRSAGALHWMASVAPAVLVTWAVDRRVADRLALRAAYVAALTWVALGTTSLHRTAHRLVGALERGDVPAARAELPALCGRDPSGLDVTALRRAVLESVAENTSDAAVAPLVWGALAGPAGLVGYRVVNTLDAMVGHRSERYERFGWTAARVDDVANLLPARLTAGLTALLAPTVAGRTGGAVAVWRRDAAAHPSPNAGCCEAAFAGALDVRLGGPTTYPYGVSHRPWLGDGRDPETGDVERAVALSHRVVLAAAVACALASLVRWSR